MDMNTSNCENFRNSIINEPRVFGPSYSSLQTPLGRVPTTQVAQPPPLPPRPFCQPQQSMMYNQMSPYAAGPSMYGAGGGLMGSSMYGSGYGGYSMGGYGGFGFGGMGAYNRFGGTGMYGLNPNDPENRFIQMAEDSSRPAFQSIESLVMAISNIASMLDSTFFALTNSFRAVLGVAANFGRLRGVFAQFWSTFTLFRAVTWLYKKCLYLLGITKLDPSTVALNEVYNAVANGNGTVPGDTAKVGSAWPVLAFLSFIITAPYIISKLIGQVTNSAIEESRNPNSWVKPLCLTAQYKFDASNAQELSMQGGQTIYVAPREVQQTQKLLNTGWALATIDFKRSGLIPINYLKRDSNASAAQPKVASQIIDKSPEMPMENFLTQMEQMPRMAMPQMEPIVPQMPTAKPINIVEPPVNVPVVANCTVEPNLTDVPAEDNASSAKQKLP